MLTILVTMFCASCGSSDVPFSSEADTSLLSSGSDTAIAASAPDPIVGAGYSGYSVAQAQAPTIAAAQAQSNAVTTQPQNLSNTNNGLNIVKVEVSDITTDEATIYWQLNGLATGQIAYGKTAALGQWSALENTYLFEAHNQKLSLLEPNTLYYYRAHSRDKSGAEAISDIDEFRTKPASAAANEATANSQVQIEAESGTDSDSESVVSAEVWPEGANGELPWGGIFYGNAITGQLATNSVLALQQSRRFRAERSGDVVAVRLQNRVLFNRNIESRCDGFGSSSVWCKCEHAGLDEYTCGYTLPNSYSVGNGGSIHIEVRPDNGGVPADKVLARTEVWIPQDHFKETGNANATFSLDKAATLIAGQTYHLVYLNSNPPTSCDIRNVSVSAAASCPRNQGMLSLNGVYDTSYPQRTGRYGPFRGNSSMNLYRSAEGAEWKESKKGLSFYELHYEDGVKVGDTYNPNTGDSFTKTVQGSAHARQSFIVRDASREVDGVWLSFGHTSSADGSPLTATLRDVSGQPLAKGQIEASAECIASDNARCREWGYADFGKSVNLVEGQQYTVDFNGGSKAGFIMLSLEPLITQAYRDRNHWTDARAEFSTNSGGSWDAWADRLADERDLAVLFTIRGMPRQLP